MWLEPRLFYPRALRAQARGGARGHGPPPAGKQHGLYVGDVGDGVNWMGCVSPCRNVKYTVSAPQGTPRTAAHNDGTQRPTVARPRWGPGAGPLGGAVSVITRESPAGWVSQKRLTHRSRALRPMADDSASDQDEETVAILHVKS